MEKESNKNCDIVRRFVTQYVQKRVAGGSKSTLGNESDLLSLFLQSPDIFTEEVIVDELLDFINAGTETT